MKKKLVLIAIPAVAVLAAIGYFMSLKGAVEVNTTAAVKGNISEYVEEIGEVDLRNKVKVNSPVSGEVLDVLVSSGDTVAEGDLLIRLDGTDATRQLAELDAQILAAQAQLNDAKRAGNSDAIKSLELDIANLSAQIAEDEIKLKDMKALYEAGAISQESYRSSERALEAQKLNLQKMRLQLNQLKSPVSQNIVSQFEAQLKQLQIQRESMVDYQGDFVITASIPGTVMNLQAEKGDYLQPGTTVLEIGDMEKLFITADVLVGDIAGIEEGTKVEISSKDLGIDNITGKVTMIHPNAFTKVSDLGIEQKRIRVEIDFIDAPENIKPGYDLELNLILKERENTLIVPENSVFKLDGKSFVFVADNGTSRLREVETGIKGGRDIEVLSGLQEGELVIESPDEELEEGKKVKAMNND
jgi:HlyD family secretion protein